MRVENRLGSFDDDGFWKNFGGGGFDPDRCSYDCGGGTCDVSRARRGQSDLSSDLVTSGLSDDRRRRSATEFQQTSPFGRGGAAAPSPEASPGRR